MFQGEDTTQGEPGEALLEWFSHVEGSRDGSSRGAQVPQKLRLRPIVAGAPAEQQEVRVFVRIELAKSMGNLPDDLLPVRVDPGTGRVLTVDTPRLEERMAGRTAEAEKALSPDWRDEVSYVTESIRAAPEAARTVASLPKHWLGALKSMRGPAELSDGGIAPGDPALEPVEGVGFDTWVTIRAEIIRTSVPTADRDALAQRWDVPAGRWQAIDTAWQQRRMSDWRLAQRAGTHEEVIRAAPDRGVPPST